VTKYGARAVASPAVDAEPGRRAVLVAGQVSDDQSVRLGGAGVRGALDLLARVRAVEPDAYILFKPHPDVEAGHRHGAVADADALQFADEIVRDRPLPDLLAAVDAVHVLTSLCGFEALLRGREVVVHGQPFYAGWGLTRDLAPPPRRGRPLNLAELVAGALILYPRYLDPATGLPCPPEILISRLVDAAPRPTALTRARRIQGWISARTRPLDARTPETTS
jgi:capsular polysaccharide export protein